MVVRTLASPVAPRLRHHPLGFERQYGSRTSQEQRASLLLPEGGDLRRLRKRARQRPGNRHTPLQNTRSRPGLSADRRYLTLVGVDHLPNTSDQSSAGRNRRNPERVPAAT